MFLEEYLVMAHDCIYTFIREFFIKQFISFSLAYSHYCFGQIIDLKNLLHHQKRECINNIKVLVFCGYYFNILTLFQMCYEKSLIFMACMSLVVQFQVNFLMLGQSKITNFVHFDNMSDIYEKHTHCPPVYHDYVFSRSSTSCQLLYLIN